MHQFFRLLATRPMEQSAQILRVYLARSVALVEQKVQAEPAEQEHSEQIQTAQKKIREQRRKCFARKRSRWFDSDSESAALQTLADQLRVFAVRVRDLRCTFVMDFICLRHSHVHLKPSDLPQAANDKVECIDIVVMNDDCPWTHWPSSHWLWRNDSFCGSFRGSLGRLAHI